MERERRLLDVAVEVEWTRQARNDLLEIFVLIGLEQPVAAERYFNRIEEKAVLLSHHPRAGVSRPDIAPGLRMLVEAPYLILYRIEPDADDGPARQVEIVRVVDGRRDLFNLHM